MTIGITKPNKVIITGGATVENATDEPLTDTTAFPIFTNSTNPIGKRIPASKPAIIKAIISFVLNRATIFTFLFKVLYIKIR